MTQATTRQDPHKTQRFISTVDPTAYDDKTEGFDVGSEWFNKTTGKLWFCTSAAIGAAVWKAPVPLGMKALGFAGHNGAPASITLTGAVAGQSVVLIFEVTGPTLDASALFESVISVNNQIQQLSNTDLSSKKYIAVLG